MSLAIWKVNQVNSVYGSLGPLKTRGVLSVNMRLIYPKGQKSLLVSKVIWDSWFLPRWQTAQDTDPLAQKLLWRNYRKKYEFQKLHHSDEDPWGVGRWSLTGLSFEWWMAWGSKYRKGWRFKFWLLPLPHVALSAPSLQKLSKPLVQVSGGRASIRVSRTLLRRGNEKPEEWLLLHCPL